MRSASTRMHVSRPAPADSRPDTELRADVVTRCHDRADLFLLGQVTDKSASRRQSVGVCGRAPELSCRGRLVHVLELDRQALVTKGLSLCGPLGIVLRRLALCDQHGPSSILRFVFAAGTA